MEPISVVFVLFSTTDTWSITEFFGGTSTMEEHYNERVLKRRRKKRLRIGRVFFLFLLFAFLSIGFYSYFQYRDGATLADGNSINAGPFNGDAVDPKYPSIENYLLLGIDDDGSGRSRTDTMMVLSWDKSEGTMKIISFMRDLYATIPGYKSYKLNTAYYLGGVQTAKDTITGMFGIPIHHYAIVDFENFEAIVDLAFPNGVEIDVKKEMSEKIGVTLTPGVQRLNGKELLGYSRFRADAEGDFGRVSRQQEVMGAMKKEVTNPKTILQIPKVIGALSGFITTDLTAKDEIERGITFMLRRHGAIETLTVPIEGSYRFANYAHAGSVIEADIEKNKAAISDFLGMYIQ